MEDQACLKAADIHEYTHDLVSSFENANKDINI
jgi:hypothetical protein